MCGTFRRSKCFPRVFPTLSLPFRLPPPLPSFPPELLVFFSLTFPSWYSPSIRAVRSGGGEFFWVRPGFMGKRNFGKIGILRKIFFFWPRASESGNFEVFERMFWLQVIFGCVDFHKFHCFVFCVTKSVIFSRNCLFIIFD